MNEDRDNLFAGLLLSLLVSIAGAVAWGLIYAGGYFVAYIAIAEVFLALTVYNKFKKVNWVIILWISILTIILNEFAMYIADVFIVKAELNVTFSEATQVFKELLADPEIRSGFIKDTFFNLAFSAIGVGCYIATYFKKQKSAPKQANTAQTQNTQNAQNTNFEFHYTPNQLEQPQVILNEPEETLEDRLNNANKEVQAEKELVYEPDKQNENKPKSNNPLEEISSIETVTNLLLEDFTAIINKFKESNDKEVLKNDLKTLKESKISTLSSEKKSAIKSMIQFKIDYTNLSLENKKNLSILIGLIK